MFEFAGEWQKPIDYIFLAVTAFIAVNGVRYRDEEGKADFVRLLFACIAAAFLAIASPAPSATHGSILGVAGWGRGPAQIPPMRNIAQRGL